MRMSIAIALTALGFSLSALAQDAPPAAPAPAAPAPAAPAPPAVDPDLPVAKVGNETITGEEFGRFARFRLRRMSMEAGKEIQADSKFRMQAMSELIASRVLTLLAKEAKIEVTEKEINDDFETSKKLFKTAEDYDKYLKGQGLTEADLREEVTRKLLINKYVEMQTKDVKVTPEEIQKEYDDLKAKGKMNRDTKTVDLAQIVALFTAGDIASEVSAKAKWKRCVNASSRARNSRRSARRSPRTPPQTSRWA